MFEERTHDEANALHSYNDQPAVRTEYTDGIVAQTWYNHGELHRDNCDLPACDYPDRREWRFRGRFCRGGDQPSVVYANGLELWRGENNLLFSTHSRAHVAMWNGVPGYLDDGSLSVHFTDGSVIYLDEDHEFHREDGPAIIRSNGTVEYYQDGLRNNLTK
jgi:hypothetical protein